MNEHEADNIEWEKFDMDFVRLEPGSTKTLKLTNWCQGTWFDKPGLRFDVLEEDSKPARKIFSTTSKRLIRTLQPVIIKAEEQGKKVISISIRRTGEGLNTSYEVAEND